MLITEERLEKALRYLAETDERAASLRADVERAEYKAKAVRDKVFLLEEGSVAERNARAGTNSAYDDAMTAYFDALKASDAVRNKRATEAIVIEAWRSLNANRNKGHV